MTTELHNPLHNAEGCLWGVLIGDARGLPVECKSPAEIRQQFGYVDRYVRNRNHKWKSVAQRASGTISDDSQLTLALMDSLTRKKGYDLQDIKLAHIEAWQGKWGRPLGWGGSTRKSVKSYEKGQVFKPPADSAGNGPPMKIAPLAIYSALYYEKSAVGKFTNSFNAQLLKRCQEISGLTHGDPRCAVAAYCQARMIIRGIQGELSSLHSLKIAKLFIDDAIYAESQIDTIWDVQNVNWSGIDRPIDLLLPKKDGLNRLSERMCEVFCGQFGDRDFYTGGCRYTRRGYGFALDTRFVSTEIATSQSSFIMNSYPLVAYCVAKYLPFRNFLYTINETVNAGADADSNTAMTGAIAGAIFGAAAIPKSTISGLVCKKMAIKQISEFLSSCSP